MSTNILEVLVLQVQAATEAVQDTDNTSLRQMASVSRKNAMRIKMHNYAFLLFGVGSNPWYRGSNGSVLSSISPVSSIAGSFELREAIALTWRGAVAVTSSLVLGTGNHRRVSARLLSALF